MNARLLKKDNITLKSDHWFLTNRHRLWHEVCGSPISCYHYLGKLCENVKFKNLKNYQWTMLQCVFITYVKAANKILVKIVMFLTMPSIHLKLMRKHLRKTLPLDAKTMDINLDTNIKAPESQYFHVSYFCLRIRYLC